MLSQINGFGLHQPILNTMLKSLLPFILKNDEWTRYLTQLAKVKCLNIVKDNKLYRLNDSQNKCPICQKFIFRGNLFVLILHMEIEHESVPNNKRLYNSEQDHELVVKKYEFTYDGLEIHLVKKSSLSDIPKRDSSSKKSQKLSNTSNTNQSSFKDFVNETQANTFVQSSLKFRNNALLQRIFGKFSKRLQTISTGRKYYHSYNVYRMITAESEEQDSEQEREQLVERQLQRLRINDFNDVSYWDKILFLEWNNLIRKQKKQVKVLYQTDQIVNVLIKFCIICKQKQVPKINLNMHLYTLWSVGRIKDFHIIELLQVYQNYSEQNVPQSMEKE